jgi:hypothetical protein
VAYKQHYCFIFTSRSSDYETFGSVDKQCGETGARDFAKEQDERVGMRMSNHLTEAA